MKQLFILLVIGIWAATTFAQPITCYNKAGLQKIIDSENRARTARLETGIQLAPTGDYDVKYHRFRWHVDPRVKYIEGSVTTLFQVLSSSFQTIHFDLRDSMHVDSIHYHHISIAAVQPFNNMISIGLPAVIPQNNLDSITVFYSGSPVTTGFGSFNVQTHGDADHGFDSAMWTLSEPYGSRDWWPGKMTLTDKIDSIDTYVTVPAPYTTAANGMPVDTVINGNLVTYHWKHRYPIANYLVCFAAANYAFAADTVQTPQGILPVWDFWYPERFQDWLQWRNNDHAMIRLYSNLFGAYPFFKEKYGHAQMLTGGGMEHQTMTFVSAITFDLISHEMAHQWFGDKLTTHSWQDIWLNEGFAVYCTFLCYEYLTQNTGGINYYPIALSGTLNTIVSEPDGSVFVTDTTSVPIIFSSRLTYSKGAYLLHMLRWKLGDEHFFAAIKNYVNDPALVYSFSKTEFLKDHLEQESGQDLTSFFNEWFYGQGYPTYSVDWAQSIDNKISLTLSQSTSHPSVSFYEMPVPIRFKNATNDTTVVFNNTVNNQPFSVQLNFVPDSVLVDPDLHIIHKTGSIRRVPFINSPGFVVVQPNPAGNNFQLWYDAETLNIQSVTIYNVLGAEVKQVVTNVISPGIINIDIPELSAGAYLLKVNTAKGFIINKLIKQ